MRGAIMQPTFIPWVGFFDLIDQVDEFVFLDMVQFQKQSWQQRNRIIAPSGLEWLTVPVFIKGRFGQIISDVEIKKSDFPTKQLRTIHQHYSRAPYFNQYWDELQDIFLRGQEFGFLGSLNIKLIQWLSGIFGLSANFKIASEMDVANGRSLRLIDIITQLNCSEYVSPLGSAEYLKNDILLFEEAGINLVFQNYEPVAYCQQYCEFTPFASALDLLFNKGPDAVTLIRRGRSPDLQLNDL